MSDFLQQQGIATLARLQARNTSRPTSTSWSSATPFPAATPSSRKCSIGRFDTARCPRPSATTFCGAPGRSSSPARTARRPRRRSPGGCWRTAASDPSVFIGGIAENFDEQLPDRRRPRVRHRRRRIRQRLLRQDRQVPEVPARHRRRQQHRVRPRRHLPGPRLRSGWPSGDSSISSRGAGCCCWAPTARTRWRLRTRAHCPVETFGLSDGADWQAHDLQTSRHIDVVQRPPRGDADRELRAAAARSLQRAQRARGDGRRRGGRPEHRHDARGASAVSRRAPAAWSSGARPMASPSTTISRTIRPRLARRSRASARPFPDAASGRSSSRARQHRAGGSSRRTSRKALARADRVDSAGRLPIVAARGSSGCHAEQVVADLRPQGVDARYIPIVDDIVRHRRARSSGRRPRRRHVERRLRRHSSESC